MNEETNAQQETQVEQQDELKQVTMSQAELNALISKEKGRVKGKYADYDDLKAKLAAFEKVEEEQKQAEMTEVEKLQKQLAETESTNAKTLESANKRLIKAEFRLLAKDFELRSDAADDAFLLADLSNVQVNDEGNVQGVKEAIESLKGTKAYLFNSVNHANPSLGQHETSRIGTKEQSVRKLKELAEKAKKTGRIEDKVAYVQLKNEMGL